MKDIIKVRNLVKYYKQIKAVDDISFNVKEGSLFAFLGENGAGKSTTINILCTVLAKTSGSIIIDDFDLDNESKKIKNIIGIVFQNSVLDNDLTVKENLECRASYYGLAGKELINRLQELNDILELEEIINRKYGSLSGGQRRRVDIARALINRPKILFLDEPTTGLDPKTRILVWNIINKLRRDSKLTVFLTTHYMEEATDADEVVILDHGKIVADDTPNNLKTLYSYNRLIWYAPKNKRNDELLNKYNFKNIYEHNYYLVKVKDNNEIINFLHNERNIVKDYEIIKGNMDDVFLNITGKVLGD